MGSGHGVFLSFLFFSVKRSDDLSWRPGESIFGVQTIFFLWSPDGRSLVVRTTHRLLAKIVQHNLWPVVRRSDLTLKKAQFVYVIHLRLPFCLCKHIMSVMLEARDESNTGLPFGCLLTQIILQSGINVTGEPKMKIQQPIGKQTLMKSNAQLQRDDSDDEVPIPAAMPVGFPDMASSS
ncbi:uncharacterized protein LOC133854283 isoform X1 [Alnus glutinosa]|uniref:uncharacterized protein LOC133854283 isoform X1 n=1 Tax=Alnus glutinosa TaxID=3517 RepID=UPI002D786118|nr:uncharacterized protein LOC133854283 isoform X1 [Alnus glutinosa]